MYDDEVGSGLFDEIADGHFRAVTVGRSQRIEVEIEELDVKVHGRERLHQSAVIARLGHVDGMEAVFSPVQTAIVGRRLRGALRDRADIGRVDDLHEDLLVGRRALALDDDLVGAAVGRVGPFVVRHRHVIAGGGGVPIELDARAARVV